MNYSEWHQIATQAGIAEITQALELSQSALNSSWKVTCLTGQTYWARSCLARHQAFIECEVENLNFLQQAGIVCPAIVAQGKTGKTAWLMTQWQNLDDTQPSGEQILTALSRLHQQSVAHAAYGWFHDNDIHGQRQYNQWLTDWSSFYRSQRLLPQFVKARENGLAQNLITRFENLLCDDYEQDFANHQPQISLVHGNLYQSPARITSEGDVFFYHPACYYGDAEVDFAALLLAYEKDEATHRVLLKQMGLNKKSYQRLTWYQLYYALVEFNQMTRHRFELIARLLERISSNRA